MCLKRTSYLRFIENTPSYKNQAERTPFTLHVLHMVLHDHDLDLNLDLYLLVCALYL
jgi:hypothetical protein